MKNKTLGVLALLGAPSMALGILAERQIESLANSWWAGVWGMVYITTWMGGMVALRRIHFAGYSRFGRVLPLLMLGSMTVANLSNLWLIMAPSYRPTLYWVLDLFWPLSHVLMLVYGLVVVRSGRVQGWERYIPLVCGFWLPVALVAQQGLPEGWKYGVGEVYNALAWALLALVVIRTSRLETPVSAAPANL